MPKNCPACKLRMTVMKIQDDTVCIKCGVLFEDEPDSISLLRKKLIRGDG